MTVATEPGAEESTSELTGRVLNALLAMQRRSWEQGLAGQALLALGRFDLAAVLAADAVANQLPDGRLADLGDWNVVNGAAALEPVLAMATRTGDPDLAAAAQRPDRLAGRQARHGPTTGPCCTCSTAGRSGRTRSTWWSRRWSRPAGSTSALQQLDGPPAPTAESRDAAVRAHVGRGWSAAAAAGGLGRRQRLGGGRVRPGHSSTAPAGNGPTAPDRPTAVDEEFWPRSPPTAPGTVLDACLRASRRCRPVPRHRRRSKHFRGGDAGRDAGVRGVDRRRGRLATGQVRRRSAGPCWRPRPGTSAPTGCCVPPAGHPCFDRPGISAEAQAWFLLAAAAASGLTPKTLQCRRSGLVRWRPLLRRVAQSFESRTISDDQGGGELNVVAGRFLTDDLLQQAPERDPAKTGHRLADRGQRWRTRHRGRAVVEADDRKILRDQHSQPARGFQHAQRGGVAARDDRGGRVDSGPAATGPSRPRRRR